MKVEVVIENEAPVTYHVDRKKFVIGKRNACDISIKNDEVSRKHLEVYEESGKIFVVDLGSTNGTWIDNDVLVPGRKTEIYPFIPLRLGRSISVSFEIIETDIEEPQKKLKKSALKEPIKAPILTKSTSQRKNLLALTALFFLGVAIITLNNGQNESQNPSPKSAPIVKKESKKKSPARLVQLDDHLKNRLSKESCKSEIEKKVCEWIPGAKAFNNQNTLYILLDGSKYFEEGRKLNGQADTNWQVASAVFLLNGIPPSWEHSLLKNHELVFVLNQGQDELEKGAIISIKSEALENLKVILTRRRVEAVKDYGSKALKFTENYYVVTEFPNSRIRNN